MKKLVLLVAVVAAVSFASCGNKDAKKDAKKVDSTEIKAKQDSIDKAKKDSIEKAKQDSINKAKNDSTNK